MSESQSEPVGLVPAATAEPSSNIAQTIVAAAAPAPVVEPPAAEGEASSPSLFDQAEEAAIERPEWLPGKFKTGEDLSKSYQELEKKLGAHAGAPENYEMEVAEGLEDYAVDSENSLAKGFFDVMKENGVNQKTANALMNLHASQTKADEEMMALAENQTFIQDCKDMGPDRVQEIKESIQWAKGVMGEDTFELLRAIGDKNLMVGKMIDDMHKAFESKNFVNMPATASPMGGGEDLHDQIKLRLADARHGRDKSFTTRTREMTKAFLGQKSMV